MARPTLFLVYRKPGPAWVAGLPTREQPLWNEHAAFMDGIFEEGRIVLAGPYGKDGRALVVMDVRDEAHASSLFDEDPWVKAGILLTEEVVPWTIFLDSRRAPAPSVDLDL
ncbi:MAG TPA: YciI family protein [Thermoanaerobaculia bacterium]|nr:YciI family protein [Thermoanaerobaculia bacterium]